MEKLGVQFSAFSRLYDEDVQFKKIVAFGMKNNKIKLFNEEDIGNMENIIIDSKIYSVKTLKEWFEKGYNYLYPKRTAYFLSLLYEKVDIVSGVTKFFIRDNCYWLENETELIDPRLMMIVDKTYKDSLGYYEVERISYSRLISNKNYNKAKEKILILSKKALTK